MGPVQGQYVSSYFTVPDKWRPILNLKKFNKYVCHVYFRMEDIKTVREWFHKGPMCVGMDPKDAFLHVSMSAQFKKSCIIPESVFRSVPSVRPLVMNFTSNLLCLYILK